MFSPYQVLSSLPWLCAVFVFTDGRRTKREYNELSWNDCGGPDKIIHISSMAVSPMPVIIPGVMHVSFDSHTAETISQASLKLTIKKETFIGDIKIPCMFNIGSCTYDNMCTLLDRMTSEDWLGIAKETAVQIRGLFQSSGIDYNCPVSPTQMSVTQFPFQLPELPAVLSLLSSGDYKTRFEVIEHGTGRQLGCFNVFFSMEKEPSAWWSIFT